MIINTNITAMLATNKFAKNAGVQERILAKLSSGKNINKAADNPSGLAISEGMRSQVHGLAQANKNIMDGMNMANTAEAGLSIIHNTLGRMRELVVQSGDPAMTSSDLKIIKNELDQLVNNVNDVATRTHYNTITTLSPMPNEAVSLPNGNAEIVFVLDITGSMGTPISKVRDNIVKFLDGMRKKGISDVKVGIMTYYDNNYTKVAMSGSDWSSNDLVIEKTLDNIVKGSHPGSMENNYTAIQKAADNYNFSSSSKNIIMITDESGDDNALAATTTTNMKNANIIVHTVTSYNSFKNIGDQTGGMSLALGDATWGNKLVTDVGKIVGNAAGTDLGGDWGNIQIQSGANTGQTFNMRLVDARPFQIKLDDLKVDEPPVNLDKSLTTIDSAVKWVSSKRSRFGAYVNALEHLQQGVIAQEASITNAMSGITDLDMAKGITTYAKIDMLTQSSATVAARANKINDAMVNLLNFQ